MKPKTININEKHFIVPTQFDKNRSENSGLYKVKGEEYYVDKKGAFWKSELLWGTGRGNVNGFVKHPEPNFEQLWILLTESKVVFNKLGSAELLIQYPNELKEKLQDVFKNNNKLNRNLTKRLSHLDLLNHVLNHSEVAGKNPKEVDSDYRE